LIEKAEGNKLHFFQFFDRQLRISNRDIQNFNFADKFRQYPEQPAPDYVFLGKIFFLFFHFSTRSKFSDRLEFGRQCSASSTSARHY